MVIGPAAWRRWSVALLIAAVTILNLAEMVSAADTVTVRMRPTLVPFVNAAGETKNRIIHFYLTVQADAVRPICRRRADLKSRFLVTVYNRKLEGDNERHGLTVLTRDVYRVMADQFGERNVIAAHLSFDEKGQQTKANEIQKRLEQVEDCTRVRTIPTSAVSATLDSLNRPIGITAKSAVSAPVRPSPIPRPKSSPTVRAAEESSGKAAADETRDACNVELRTLWQPGWVTIEGERVWLSQVATLDFDDDQNVDDVRFLLVRDNDREFTKYYSDLHPTGSTTNIAGLTLDDPKQILSLCPGERSFSQPAAPIARTVNLDGPNLATEVAGRIKGEGPVVAVVVDDSAADFWRWTAAIVSICAVLLAGVVLVAFMIHLRKDRRRKADRRRKKRRARSRRGEDGKPVTKERRKDNDRRGKPDRREKDTRREQRDRRDT